jgi:hypothetical protein
MPTLHAFAEEDTLVLEQRFAIVPSGSSTPISVTVLPAVLSAPEVRPDLGSPDAGRACWRAG